LFKQIGSLHGGAVPVAPPKDNRPFEAESGTEIEKGAVYKFDSDGKAIDVDGDDDDDGVAILALEDADDGEKFRGQWITPTEIYQASVQGDGTDHNYEGRIGVRLHTDGKSVSDVEDVEGPLTIIKLIEIDDDDYEAQVVFNKCALSQ